MEGFILAAGRGTRLRPLTDDRPKALIEVGGMTLLERTIRRLEAAGVKHVVVNVHHFADMIVDYVASHSWQATIDISDERRQLLDTGGALKHAAHLFSGVDDVLVHNVDILSQVDLREVQHVHRQQGNLVTLCVSRRATQRLLAFDNEDLLKGRAAEGLAFSGISLVSPRLFALLPPDNAPYPAIDEYIRLSGEGYRVGSYLHSAEGWLDVGKRETLEEARRWTLS